MNRSRLKREAVQRGEPMPTFAEPPPPSKVEPAAEVCGWCMADRQTFIGCCGRTRAHHHTLTKWRGDVVRIIPSDDCPEAPEPPSKVEPPPPACSYCKSGYDVSLLFVCERCGDRWAPPVAPDPPASGREHAMVGRIAVLESTVATAAGVLEKACDDAHLPGSAVPGHELNCVLMRTAIRLRAAIEPETRC